jgi:hypothetical protein
MMKKTIITMSITELQQVLAKAEHANKYDGFSHTIRIFTEDNGSAEIELLSCYAECNGKTLLRRK